MMNLLQKFNNKAMVTLQLIVATAIILTGLPTLFNFVAIKSEHGFLSYWGAMHFNSSLGIIFLGASLIFMLMKKHKIAGVFGSIILSLGFFTLLQYILKVDFGIDELLRTSNRTVFNMHPGRMAFASSICFTLTGFVIILLNTPFQKKYFAMIAGLISSIPAGIGFITLLSYFLETATAYNTGILSHMAIPTAFAFMMGGIILIYYSLNTFLKNRNENYTMSSVFFAASLFLVFLSIWQFLINEEQKYLHNLVTLKSTSIRDELKVKIQETSLAVQRLANRTSYLGTKDRRFLSMDSKAYLTNIKILTRVGLVDKDYNVIWSYPPENNWQVQGFNHGANNYRKLALDNALRTETPALSHHVELKSGGKGFILPVIINHKNDPAKFIYVAINAKKLFENLSNISDGNYQLNIFENGESIFKTQQFSDSPQEMAKFISLQLDNSKWEIVVSPSKKFLIQQHSTAPYIVLLGGGIISMLVGFIMHFISIARKREEKHNNEQRINTAQLKVTHNRLERVIEATEEGIWERDYKSKEIKFIDTQTKKIFGYSSDSQIVYNDILAKIHPDDIVLLANAVQAHINEKSSGFHVEFRVYNKDESKKWKWVRARGKVEIVNGDLDTLVSTVCDVTHEIERRTQLEEALKAASDAALVKSAFLASMSHEIRTPLNGIIGMTDLLLETNLNEDQKRFADIVQNSGVGLLDLINDILDFSKIESGKLELENTDFSLSSVVENQIDLLIPRARKKNISLTTFISPDLPQTFRGDSGRIGQVLLNLIGNAVKFTQEGGVSIHVIPLVDLQKNANNMKIRFEVIDSGIGISDQNKSKLFSPFSQADNKISRKFGGTGLGLSISKQLVEAMKGEIGVDSVFEKGSTFWFELTLQVTNHADFFAKYPLVKDLNNIRILVINEDLLSVDAIRIYTSSWKMREITETNYETAPDIIAEAIKQDDAFDIVIAYLKSSNDAAFNLGNELKESFGAMAPRALALTDFEWKFSDEEANNQGFFETIKNPLKQSILFDSLSRAVSGEKRTRLPENNVTSILNSKTIRILIADDVKTNRLVAVSILESLGYSAYAVSSGKEAIEALEQMHFDLILMDCFMPEMDGIDATQIIRQLPNIQKRDIPIVALTANVNTMDRDQCIDAGMNGFLGKPLIKEDIQNTLEYLLVKKLVKNAAEEKVKVLLVDDNEENRTLILHYLKELPYQVDIAINGLDAFEKYKTSEYSLVLMDMQMPVMDGYESTKSIRDWEKEHDRPRTHIVALTANAMKEECDRAFSMGCDAHLSKPIRKKKLLEYVALAIAEEKVKPISLIAS
jgi:signal transduction histidine kinase/PleD family two-component response regulator/sensor domain CHASE-containing protein